MPDAVIWDLDGVLLDSEALWDAARRAVAAEAGGHWSGEATVALQGMSAPERGKPAPDVYLEAARRLEVAPDRCVAIEDSSNGLRSAAAADMRVIAVPNRSYPPTADALALAAAAVGQVREVTPELVGSL
jgi:beta-phosphoglucomutase-like phosphatase (HAD superfamily)